MDKILKLRKKIEELTKEIRGFIDSKDLAKARDKKEELRQVKEELEIEEELYEEEKRILESQAKKKSAITNNRSQDKNKELRALVKVALKKNLTEEERALVTVSGNGGVLPEEFINEIEVYRKGFPSLKKYCHVIPVSKKSGKMPAASLGQNVLAKLSSNQPIPEGAMVTDEIAFDIDDFGKFVPIERDLTEDEGVSIVKDVLLPDFAEGSVTSENLEILSIVKENSKEIADAKSYKDVEKAMNGVVPGAKGGIITITNTTGYCYLKGLEDKQGRNLNLITQIGDVEYFNGKPIVYLDDEDLKDETAQMIFYIANLKELVKFFDRKQVLIEQSKEFLFNKNQDCLRAIERFDTVKGNERSARCVKINLA